MKKHLSALAAMAVVIGAPLAAHADDTITFSGALSDSTCTVTGTGGTSSFTVNMGSPAATDLAAAGSSTSKTNFDISLTGCSSTTQSNVKPYFSGPDINTAGRLNNNFAGPGVAATQVELELFDEPADSLISLNAARGSQSIQSPSISSGSATLRFAARFYSPAGSATPGAFQSQVTYVIDYI